MKKLIVALILGGLFSTGLLALAFEKTARPAPPVTARGADQSASPVSIGETRRAASQISIGEVLRAHNFPQGPEASASFSAEAVRLTSRPSEIAPEITSFFERQVSVVMDGKTYKRHTADRLRLREQIDLFDGSMSYHAVAEKGRLTEEANPMTDSQARGAEFGVKTFGLVPILKQLSDPAIEAVYSGRTAHGLDKFEVKTATDRWTIYTDAEHLICRLEVRDKAIEYASYRSVDGVRLPFIQRVSIGGKLSQEIVFTRIDLNPKLAPGYFSREAISKEIAR